MSFSNYRPKKAEYMLIYVILILIFKAKDQNAKGDGRIRKSSLRVCSDGIDYKHDMSKGHIRKCKMEADGNILGIGNGLSAIAILHENTILVGGHPP